MLRGLQNTPTVFVKMLIKGLTQFSCLFYIFVNMLKAAASRIRYEINYNYNLSEFF
jgi:hypothetical protein